MSDAIVSQGVVMFDQMERRHLFAADVAQAGVVRQWVGAALAGHPCRDDALLVVTELFANAVLHGSRGPDNAVAVAVRRLPEGRAYVAVADSGRGGRPVATDAGTGDEAGRGLAIVDGVAARWGIGRDGPGWRVFAVLGTEGDTEPAARRGARGIRTEGTGR